MARNPGRFVKTIIAFSLLLTGIVFPLSRTACAQGEGSGLSTEPGIPRGEIDGAALAAGEDARGAVATDPAGEGSPSPDRLERWREMSPEERERIRERYRRWKDLPPEKRERIIERNRRWMKLPPEERGYLKERRELLQGAGPEVRAVVRKFFARMRSLPPPARRLARRNLREWRSLPAEERDEAMRSWPFYRGLSGRERETLRWFLFGRPGDPPPGA